jgi:molecular chaperone DnaK (HSP70)
VLSRHNWDLRGEPEIFDRLVLQCEQAKIKLSSVAETAIDLAQVDPAAPAAAESVKLDRGRLAELAQPLVSRTFVLCDQVLREASLTAAQIDAVYLAGGTTLLPLVRESVASYFGTLPRCEFDPMEVVAIGASLMSP